MKEKVDKAIYKGIGEVFKDLRLRKKYSLEYVGDHVGVSKVTVKRYEDGQSRIDGSVFLDLCRLYGIEPNFVLEEASKTATLLKNPIFEDDDSQRNTEYSIRAFDDDTIELMADYELLSPEHKKQVAEQIKYYLSIDVPIKEDDLPF